MGTTVSSESQEQKAPQHFLDSIYNKPDDGRSLELISALKSTDLPCGTILDIWKYQPAIYGKYTVYTYWGLGDENYIDIGEEGKITCVDQFINSINKSLKDLISIYLVGINHTTKRINIYYGKRGWIIDPVKQSENRINELEARLKLLERKIPSKTRSKSF